MGLTLGLVRLLSFVLRLVFVLVHQLLQEAGQVALLLLGHGEWILREAAEKLVSLRSLRVTARRVLGIWVWMTRRAASAEVNEWRKVTWWGRTCFTCKRSLRTETTEAEPCPCLACLACLPSPSRPSPGHPRFCLTSNSRIAIPSGVRVNPDAFLTRSPAYNWAVKGRRCETS